MDFFYRYKKILMVVGFLAVVILMAVALYYMFFASAPTSGTPAGNQAANTASTSANTLPGSGEGNGPNGTETSTPGRLTTGEGGPGNGQPPANNNTVVENNPHKTSEVTQGESIGATAGSNGGVQYYNKSDGKFYSIASDGTITALSDQVFHDVQNVTWAPDKSKAILEYPDGTKIVYDFAAQKQVTLPKHWQDFGFSPNGSQIVMKSIGLDPDNRWLAVANNDGSKAKTIEQVGENADSVIDSWSPNNQVIAMYTQGVDMNRQDVYFVGQNNENFKSMTIEGRGFQPQWSPDGSHLLYSVYSTDTNLKPGLWVANAQGDQIGTGRKSLDIETWANKCTFADANNLYCAVPDNLPEGAGLYPETAQNTTDQLYAIDTRTGTKKLVSTPDGSYNMSNMIVSDDGSTLYFTDSNTQKIYKIKLK